MYLNYSYFPVFTAPLSHPWVLLLFKKNEEKGKEKKFNLSYPYSQWSMV